MIGITRWACVRCGTVLEASNSSLACRRCSTTYPIVGGAPVLVARPDPFLFFTRRKLIAERLKLAVSERRLGSAGTEDARVPRARRELDAQRRNQTIVEQLCFQKLPQPSDVRRAPTDFLLERRTGWDAADLLPYFCVDWTDSRAYRVVASAVGTAATLCDGAGLAAVLGSGGGRLLLELAPRFAHVAGVDLSLPSLLLAGHLLSGGRMDVCLKSADWNAVELQGPAKAPTNITLAAADAARLPFADDSLSFVVTQYLLDIIPDPETTAQEINRVLRPGGVWFSFGLPFRLLSDPRGMDRWQAQDMAEFSARFGFELLAVETREFSHLDLTSIDPKAVGWRHEIIEFTVRKAMAAPPDEAQIALRDFYGGEKDRLLRLAPRIRKGQTLAASETCFLEDGREHTAQEIQLGASQERIQLPPVARRLIEKLWRGLDGSRALGEILALIDASFPGVVQEDDVILTLEELRNIGVVEFSWAP